MANLHQSSQSSMPRRHRRFPLRYPVRVTLQLDGVEHELDGVTQNVSVGGLLLETTSAVPNRSCVSFVMKVSGGRLIRPINITGTGEVVRVEDSPKGEAKFHVAVACKRPMTLVEHIAMAS